MPNTTTNFGLLQPLVNNPTDADLWGGYLNTDIGNIDTLLLTCLNWTASSKTATFSVTIPTAGSTTTGSAKKIYTCDATSTGFAANLPAVATAAGLTVGFKKTDTSANIITITGNSSDTIDGSNTFALSAQYAYVVLTCDGAKWNIIAQTAPAAAVQSLVAPYIVTATGAFTFTTPSNITTSTVFKLTLTAGGGGGAGAIGTATKGGSGGETVMKWISGLSPNTAYSGVIGAGGAAGSSGAGGNGADSTFTVPGPTTYTAHKGTGGAASSGAGPLGGTGGNGDINIPGGSGGNGYTSSSTDKGGAGGGTWWGPGSPDNAAASGAAGVDATSYGAGGSAGGSSNTGGAGKSGICMLEWVA